MKILPANWQAPKNITALTSTRFSGFSQPPFESNNLALHTQDNEQDVLKNRQQMQAYLHLPAEPQWLTQTHSTRCVEVEKETSREADAAISRSFHHPLVILTADCLPITLCDMAGTEIAAIHAGWRGLAHGIIDNTLKKMNSLNSNLIAWIGPAICSACYETGDEVYETFLQNYPFSQEGFQRIDKKWHANLSQIAALILQSKGIKMVYQSKICTFEAENEYYSYRKNSQTGRIGTFIWFNDQPQGLIS